MIKKKSWEAKSSINIKFEIRTTSEMSKRVKIWKIEWNSRDIYRMLLTDGHKNIEWFVVWELQVTPSVHSSGSNIDMGVEVFVLTDDELNRALVAHHVTFELPGGA